MFPSKTLLYYLTLFTLLSFVNASPIRGRNAGRATLRFATEINKRGIGNLAEKDRARAQALKQAGKFGKRDESVNVTSSSISYLAQVGIGSPPTNYTLLIDTASSNTFVGLNQSYVQTSSSQDTGNTVSDSYGSYSWSGEEWTDTVTLSSNLVVQNQSIGVANTSSGFSGMDGILGVGPTDLTDDTVANNTAVPTVMDNLYSNGLISEEVLGVYFVPSAESDNTGELTFGGYDENVITGSVNYVPITKTSPSNEYWGVDQSITYGGQTILNQTAGIVETGITLILLATDAFQAYQNATGGVMDSATGMLKITADQYDNLQTLTFNIGSNSYDLTPNGQIWPRSLNSAVGGESDGIYLVIGDIGFPSGSGLDFLNGYVFLQRYYTVYDTTNGEVGFAPTAYTDSTSN